MTLLLRDLLGFVLLPLFGLALLLGFSLRFLLCLLLDPSCLGFLLFLFLLIFDELFLLLKNLKTLLVRGRVGRDFEFGFVDLGTWTDVDSV